MSTEVCHHTFSNQFTLLYERVPSVRSVAFNFYVKAGCVNDPDERQGLSGILSDLITRGAGERDNRALTLALDSLGLDRNENAGIYVMSFWGTTLARNLYPALEIYADILRRPTLPVEELDAVKELALQDLQSLEDEPAEKMMVALHNHHYPAPLGRDPRGTKEGIEGTTIQDVRDLYSDCVHPENTIMSVAGNVEWVQLLDQVGKLFGDWQRRKPRSFILGSRPGPRAHLSKETEQTQIGVAYESVPIGHPQYYAALGAVKVLSGGMSARLFTEIREKEGLCYAVSARYLGLKDRGSVICYAGSRNDRAQRTLDLLLHELNRLKDGIADDEVIRLKAGLKSSLIMQQESTFSRAGAIASDWYHLGRVRTLEEIQSAVDSLTPERIVSHVREYPPREFTIVTLGPSELQVHASE